MTTMHTQVFLLEWQGVGKIYLIAFSQMLRRQLTRRPPDNHKLIYHLHGFSNVNGL